MKSTVGSYYFLITLEPSVRLLGIYLPFPVIFWALNYVIILMSLHWQIIFDQVGNARSQLLPADIHVQPHASYVLHTEPSKQFS